MNLLNLAIAFALFALVGCAIMLMGNAVGLAMIILGELACFICVYTDEQKTKRGYRKVFG